MIKYIATCLLLISTLGANAQNATPAKGNGQMEGIIVENESKSPI